MLIIDPKKSRFHRNLQHLLMSFWGLGGPHTPAELRSHIFNHNTACSPHRGGPEIFFSLYNKGKKKFGLCLIVLISFNFCVHFLWFSLILEVLCKPIISYFTPIFLALISYIFELKIYILHQSAVAYCSSDLPLLLYNVKDEISIPT